MTCRKEPASSNRGTHRAVECSRAAGSRSKRVEVAQQASCAGQPHAGPCGEHLIKASDRATLQQSAARVPALQAHLAAAVAPKLGAAPQRGRGGAQIVDDTACNPARINNGAALTVGDCWLREQRAQQVCHAESAGPPPLHWVTEAAPKPPAPPCAASRSQPPAPTTCTPSSQRMPTIKVASSPNRVEVELDCSRVWCEARRGVASWGGSSRGSPATDQIPQPRRHSKRLTSHVTVQSHSAPSRLTGLLECGVGKLGAALHSGCIVGIGANVHQVSRGCATKERMLLRKCPIKRGGTRTFCSTQGALALSAQCKACEWPWGWVRSTCRVCWATWPVSPLLILPPPATRRECPLPLLDGHCTMITREARAACHHKGMHASHQERGTQRWART